MPEFVRPLGPEETKAIEQLIRSRTVPAGVYQRALIVQWSSRGPAPEPRSSPPWRASSRFAMGQAALSEPVARSPTVPPSRPASAPLDTRTGSQSVPLHGSGAMLPV